MELGSATKRKKLQTLPLPETIFWLQLTNWTVQAHEVVVCQSCNVFTVDFAEFRECVIFSAPGVWLEYVQFSIGGKEGMECVREVFESALTACGLHFTRGEPLWEAYREWENAILAGLQVSERIISLKLLSMNETFADRGGGWSMTHPAVVIVVPRTPPSYSCIDVLIVDKS